MAQLAASPTPNVLKPPPPALLPAHLANSLFYPRKEFLPNQPRVPSSFSLLTLAGHGFVRLYGFPPSVINGLRRLFDNLTLTLDVRENVTNHFFEFSLDKKPWANIKSLASERLIVAIFSVIFQHGYSFLSTIDYAREHDDRVAIAFSRPSPAPVNSSLPAVPNPSASASTLPHAGPMLFAISFPSNSLLRVIDPPLPLTPGILQAVRGAWPRGVASEKKLGDSYEFKLKGYRWFQENTFAVDSLQQTLSLLNNLDRHSFKLLTSLTLGSRSRTRDFWVFTGPTEESPPASPAGSSLELKRDIAPHKCSPLKQVTQSNSTSSNSKLKKPCPKGDLPRAFQSVSSFNDQSMNENSRLPSEVGSIDMTGVGTAHRRAATQPPTPDVFYATGPVKPGNAYQQEFNPWNRALSPPPPQAIPPQTSQFLTAPSSWRRQPSRHYSISSTDDPILRGIIHESPYDIARQSSSSNDSRLRRASSPLSASYSPQPLQFTPTAESGPRARHSADGPRPYLMNVDSDPPRIPTPPLLSAGAFRDSGLTTGTGWRSIEVPITWTGKDPVPTPTDAPLSRSLSAASRVVPHGPRERRSSSGGRAELQVPHPPLEHRGSSGPALPGAWASQEQPSDDVVESRGTPPVHTTRSSQTSANSNMIPPTIKEQPSQEGDESTEKRGLVQARSPEHHRAEGEGARKSEAAFIGNTADRPGHSPSPYANGHCKMSPSATSSTKPTVQRTANGHGNGVADGNGHPHRPPQAPRGASIAEGWVLVNVDSRKTSSFPSRSSGQSSAPAVLLKHQRSQSDSRVPAATSRASLAGAAKSTMSAAAKAIVAADAMEQTREKQQSGGKLRRLLGRTPVKDKDKAANGHTPEASTASQQSARASRPKQIQPTQTTKARK
ncbi:hypothetical protein LXA43DRAFT_969011 [Ganoderma leucocontextum]|nr:hypothetical protein LXA43DRAFT_969011 [Ganoderma leucocontextum]